MGPVPFTSEEVVGIELLRDPGPRRQECEQELDAAGSPLPLPSRCCWAEAHRLAGSWFLAARDSQGRCQGGFAVEVNRSRALPGHLLLRAERFGSGVSDAVGEAGLEALAGLARANRRILRVNVELFERAAKRRAALEQALRRHGFRQVAVRRRYAQTIAVDLTPDEDQILASFHGMARRNIRKLARGVVAVRTIDDARLADRIEELVRATLARTGGHYQPRDWPALIRLSIQEPTRSRLVGLFRTDQDGPGSLLSLAWGQHHGTYAHYDVGASVPAPDLNVPLAYALIWDLLCWARRHGAHWFDLGGITAGHCHDGTDPLGGISDFKRYFSREVVEVGGEWMLEPHWFRGRLAAAVSAGAHLLGRLRTALRKSKAEAGRSQRQ